MVWGLYRQNHPVFYTLPLYLTSGSRFTTAQDLDIIYFVQCKHNVYCTRCLHNLHSIDSLHNLSSTVCRFQWPRGLRRRSAAARLLRSWVWIPLGASMFVCCVVCCQVEVSATSWSLVQRSPTDCAPSVCVRSRNLKNEEAMTRVGSQRHKKNPPQCV